MKFDYLKSASDLVFLANCLVSDDLKVVTCGVAVFSRAIVTPISLYNSKKEFIGKLVPPEIAKTAHTTVILSDCFDHVSFTLLEAPQWLLHSMA